MFELVGFFGGALILGAYWQLTIGKWGAKSVAYLASNICGSGLLALSMLGHWAIAGALLQIAWLGISGISLYRAFSKRQLTLTAPATRSMTQDTSDDVRVRLNA